MKKERRRTRRSCACVVGGETSCPHRQSRMMGVSSGNASTKALIALFLGGRASNNSSTLGRGFGTCGCCICILLPQKDLVLVSILHRISQFPHDRTPEESIVLYWLKIKMVYEATLFCTPRVMSTGLTIA